MGPRSSFVRCCGDIVAALRGTQLRSYVCAVGKLAGALLAGSETVHARAFLYGDSRRASAEWRGLISEDVTTNFSLSWLAARARRRESSNKLKFVGRIVGKEEPAMSY